MEKLLRQIHAGRPEQVGTTQIFRPLPAPGFKKLGPFLLLDHMGPRTIKPGSEVMKIGAHPHRGFEPVTVLFEGYLEHRDSMGNHGLLEGGDVQWMTAGSGVVHEEGLQERMGRDGGVAHFVQLWVNLPKAHKYVTPDYQDIKAANIPVLALDGGARLRLVAGNYADQRGPARTFSPLIIAHVIVPANTTTHLRVPADFDTGIFAATGSVRVQGHVVEPHALAEFHGGGETIAISTGDKEANLLLLAGEPINEPLVTYGPFVVNTLSEVHQAIDDYEAGRMGTISQQ